MRFRWSDVKIKDNTYDTKKVIFGVWKFLLWPLLALQSNSAQRSKTSMNVRLYLSLSVANHDRNEIFDPCPYMILVVNITLYLISTCVRLSRSYIEFLLCSTGHYNYRVLIGLLNRRLLEPPLVAGLSGLE